MVEMLKKMTVRSQLTLTIFVSTLIVLLIASGIFAYFEAIDRINNTQKISQTAVNVLAQDFVRSAVFKSSDVAVDMARNLEAFNSITHAIFLTEDDVPILIYKRAGEETIEIKPEHDEKIVVLDNAIRAYMPIVLQGKTYGMAIFQYDKTSFNDEYIAFVRDLIFVIPVLLIISILISFYFQRFFTGPIMRLTHALDDFGKNVKEIVLDENFSSLEISKLFSGFNRMSRLIEHDNAVIKEQKERFRTTLESIVDGVIATDKDGHITYMNPSAEAITGWGRDEATGLSASDVYQIVDEVSEKSMTDQLDESLLSGKTYLSFEKTALLDRQRNKFLIQSSISPIIDDMNAVSGIVIVFQNVTESRKLSQKLRHQAAHDPLTDLMNRTEFERILTEELEHNDQEYNHVLLYLDLDQFKVVNDTSGHTAGDSLLMQVASLLRVAVREADIVARLGGDEFAVFLPGCNEQQAIEIAEKIKTSISSFVFIWQDKHFKIGVSIGLVPVASALISYGELMQCADLSCYVAKEHGRNRIHVYREKDQDFKKRVGEMNWVGLIRDGLASNNFLLFVQQVDAIDINNPEKHLEVLIRYKDDKGKMHAPDEFLPAAEKYTLAPLLDRWVIDSVFRNVRLLDFLRKNTNFRININLSGLTVGDSGISDFIIAQLDRVKLPPKSFCFEITETAAVANISATSHLMRVLKLQGCEFALDDFGIGVSSFSYLKNLPVDYLKIDGSFVKDIDSNPVNEAMVNAINQVGHVMGIKTVAEYVENAAILSVLSEIGVDFSQGYFTHVPCELDDYLSDSYAIQLGE